MNIDIIIPSCKDRSECEKEIRDIERTRKSQGQLIFTGLKASASCNRNEGLRRSTAEYILMLDDDMDVFYSGFDIDMIIPLLNPNIVMTSARLMDKNGGYAYMLSDERGGLANAGQYAVVGKRELPTACVAWKRNSIMFDENFIGSGFEDNDFCRQMQQLYPQGQFVIVNNCKLVHINEKKNQHDISSGCDKNYWSTNKAYYMKKWNLSIL